MLRVLGRSLLVTLMLFALLAGLLVWALAGTNPCALLDGLSCPLGGGATATGALLLTLGTAWLLFPAVAMGIVAGFAERVVAAVEARHYPAAAHAGRPVRPVRLLWLGLRSAGRLLLYNLIALPFAILLLVTGVGPLLLLLAANGLALGRDYGEMVVARHPGEDGRSWLRASRGERFLTGCLAAALFLVPIVNLFAPMLGIAVAVHLFHRGAAPRDGFRRAPRLG